MGPGRDRTRDHWICSQTGICCQTRYRLRYAAQYYRYHKLRKTFSKFYRQYYNLISKSLLRKGLSEPEFYGDLVYKLKKIVSSDNFSAQFIKIISHYNRLAITLMYCNRLHAWWSTQSRLATLHSSLISCQWVRTQTMTVPP